LFTNIYGKDEIVTYLEDTVQKKNPANAYLIHGERGSGKELLAGLFAYGLQCEGDGTALPCMKCDSCKKAASDNHPDIKFIAHEKPGIISVDDVRSQINEDVHIRPYDSRFKIYVIAEAEKMTVQAQNALLKTLEEPPEYAIIILIANDTGDLLSTIISRCVCLHRKPLSDAGIMQYLTKELRIPETKAAACAAFARGNIGKAKRLATNDEFSQIMSEALAMLRSLHKMDLTEISDAVKKIREYGLDIDDYLDILLIWFRDALVYKATCDCNHLVFKDEFIKKERFTDLCSYESLEDILNALNRTKLRLKANANFEMTMELLFLSIRDSLNAQ